MSSKLPLFVTLAGGVALAGLTAAPVATAAPTIAITVGADPAESITTQLGVTGDSTEGEDRASLKVKPAGGRGCAANEEADEGSTVIFPFQLNLGDAGPFSDAPNWTFQSAGSYLLCAWLEHYDSGTETVVATSSLTVAVRPPHLAISIQVPPTVSPGRTFQVAMTVQAETEREAYEYLLPNNGRGCPANADAAQSTAGELGIRGYGVNIDGGPTTVSDNMTLTTLGAYTVCAYIEYPNSASVPEATASAAISVARPRPACVIPKLGTNQGLDGVESKIRSAHCKVGKIRYEASAHRRRGVVLRLSPPPGTRLASNGFVAITVSSGPPPRRHRHKRH